MKTKVKKAHTIRVVGVSCHNGKTYKLNVSGRSLPLQLFQAAIPGHTEFHFVKLPKVVSNKQSAVAYMIKQHGLSSGEKSFLKDLLAKYEAVTNKKPGKRGRPVGKKNTKVKAKVIVKKAVVTKVAKPIVVAKSEPMVVVPEPVVAANEVVATIEPVVSTPVKSPLVSDAEAIARKEKTIAMLREAKLKAAGQA